MGFRPEVKNFQPKYVWRSTPQKLIDLRVGCAILHEALDRINSSEQQKSQSKETEKEAKERVARQVSHKLRICDISLAIDSWSCASDRQVKLAFDDDRKTKEMRDRMERERRIAMEAVPIPTPTSPNTSHPTAVGSRLSGEVVTLNTRAGGNPVTDTSESSEDENAPHND